MLTADAPDGSGPARALAVVYDETAKTLSVGDGATSQAYRNVTICTVSINGAGPGTTIDIDQLTSAVAP